MERVHEGLAVGVLCFGVSEVHRHQYVEGGAICLGLLSLLEQGEHIHEAAVLIKYVTNLMRRLERELGLVVEVHIDDDAARVRVRCARGV